MKLSSLLTQPVLMVALIASADPFAPAGAANATGTSNPDAQYRMDICHQGSASGELIGQYALPRAAVTPTGGDRPPHT